MFIQCTSSRDKESGAVIILETTGLELTSLETKGLELPSLETKGLVLPLLETKAKVSVCGGEGLPISIAIPGDSNVLALQQTVPPL